MYVKECIKSAIKQVLLTEKSDFKQIKMCLYQERNKNESRLYCSLVVGKLKYMFSIILGIKLTFMAANTSTYLPQCALLLHSLHCVPSQSALLAERQTAVPLWNILRLSRTRPAALVANINS